MHLPGKILTLLMLALCGTARAHVGLENTTDVRIYPNRMEILTRTSIPLAWALLGQRAPLTTDASGQAAALPHLLEEAPRLLEVTTSAGAMVPSRTDCVFELHDDVAFTLVFPRPTTWPVTIRASFVSLLGEMDLGTVSAYDHTTAGYKRDMDPFIVRPISRRHPTASFSLITPEAEKTSTAISPRETTHRRVWLIPLIIAAMGMVLHRIFRRWNRQPE